jgi:hypothetical protein
VFRFSAGRAGKHPGQHLAGFKGTLQADAFSGFDHLYRGGAMVEAGCLGHARRKLVDLVRAKGSPVAAAGVKQIAALYRIERRIYGLPPAERLTVRRSEAVPLLDALRIVLRLLCGESFDAVSREIGFEVYRLERWRNKALAAMDAGRKERADDDPLQAGLDAAHKRVGELSMKVELLRTKIGRLETGTPFPRARSRR